MPINRISIFALFHFFLPHSPLSFRSLSVSHSHPVEKLAWASGFYFIPSLSSPFIVAPLLSLSSADNPPVSSQSGWKVPRVSIWTLLPWNWVPLTYWLGTVLKERHVSAIKEPSFTSPSWVPEEGVHQKNRAGYFSLVLSMLCWPPTKFIRVYWALHKVTRSTAPEIFIAMAQ